MHHHQYLHWMRRGPFEEWAGHEHGRADCGPKRGGPWARGGRRGGPGWFGFAPGGPPGFDFRAGRKISSADLQLLLLALLGEQPRHGYDLIKAIEERSRGFYVPSPGVIYPALTYLEEAGHAVAEAKGPRKLYALTDEGRTTLESRRAEADELLAQLDELGRRMGRLRDALGSEDEEGGEDDSLPRGEWAVAFEFKKMVHELRSVLRRPHHRGMSNDQRAQIVTVLRRAVKEIHRILESESEK
jgi:DNA-binding PadR family transcriptional regulator